MSKLLFRKAKRLILQIKNAFKAKRLILQIKMLSKQIKLVLQQIQYAGF